MFQCIVSENDKCDGFQVYVWHFVLCSNSISLNPKDLLFWLKRSVNELKIFPGPDF